MTMQRVRVLLNPNAGPLRAANLLVGLIQKYWDNDNREVTFQFSRTPEDGCAKARRAIADGVDAMLVCGGDGMINTIGRELIGTGIPLGVIPTGSGNGFARHFGIPLNPMQAVRALRDAKPLDIDVGVLNARPFFVTCSMASEATIARIVEKSPIRGLLPYLWATPMSLVDHRTQSLQVRVDDTREFTVESALLFTIANVTQFGGGACIAPNACADDGMLELVYAERRDLASIVPHFNKLFNGTFADVPSIHTVRFRKLRVTREHADPVQIDGELLPPVRDVHVDVLQGAIRVLVPQNKV